MHSRRARITPGSRGSDFAPAGSACTCDGAVSRAATSAAAPNVDFKMYDMAIFLRWLRRSGFARLFPESGSFRLRTKTGRAAWWLACRTPDNIVVNLPDVDDVALAGYRHA